MPVPLTLPIVSISPYLPSCAEQYSDADRAKVAEHMHRACRDIGFFYLRVDDYLGEHEMRSVLERGREFFLQATKDEKAEIGLVQGDGVRGYQKLKQNITMGKADHHEGLDFYAPSPYPDGESRDETGQLKPLGHANQWPKKPTDFRPEMEEWIAKMKVLGMIVMKAMADGLGMEDDEWEELSRMVQDTFWVMRVIGYPPLPQSAEGVSCGAHKDYGCLTSPTFRVSLPFFYEPAFTAQVEPLEAAKRKIREEGWIMGRKGKDYEGVRYGEFLLNKVAGNFVKSAQGV
ncbi:hypothetical protein QFC21_005982 [Naganishia friedmannii]|uniref:Uncharacterized protein n=1 Tax=Naganishia friedmannii TaxID=89922 RepID=A0ACC2V5Q1_9TREE|nr:hypothetical protein QFC21_005982 [Naganishia friedmannii]